MRIAIVGASGTLGRPTAELLKQRGHEVRRLGRSSRSWAIELRTGAGLSAALAGVDVVINASNGPPSRRARAVLVDGTKRLLAATDAHHVCVSIVGSETVPGAYYRAKVDQEAVVRGSGRLFTIVRSTQFHDLIGGPLRAVAHRHLELRSRILLAPVDVSEVAAVVAGAAERAATGETITIGGPEVLTLTRLRVAPGVPLPLPLPPGPGRALRAGALTIADPDVRGATTYAEWLAR